MHVLLSLLVLPMAFAQGKRYHEWQLLSLAIGTCMTIAWLIAPLCIWGSMGPAWTLLWLLPTGTLICLHGLSRELRSGGG